MRQRKYKFPALVLALALLLTACGGENTAATMHLVRTEGMVRVDNAEGKNVKVSENLGLYSGYEVSTQAESYGWITLDDVKLAKIDASSDVEIRKKDKLLELYVRSGGLFFNVTEPLAEDEVMNIRTSTMAVGIRGTCGWVDVEDNKLMCVYLLKGKVECSIFGEDGSVLASETITAGQAAKLVLDGDEFSIVTAEFDTGRLPDFVKDALENPENWNIPGDAESWNVSEETEDSEHSDSEEEPQGSQANASHAVDQNGKIIHDIHVREEGDVLYFSGTGIVEAEDYEGYTPVNVVVEEGITGIGDRAFGGCESLISVQLPYNLISIGDYAFSRCPLTSVTFPDSLISIGDRAFDKCPLTSVAFPDSLRSIGDYAFDECTDLTSVTWPSNLESIGRFAFRGCSLTAVTLPDSLVSIGDGTFSWCHSLTSVSLPDNLVSIGKSAFTWCPLTSVTFPDSLVEIGEGAFSGCPLTSVVWSSSLESIGKEAFYGCPLTSVTFPDSLRSIGDRAFIGCIDLTSVTWPSNLESIGEEAFSGGCPLNSIVLPEGLKSIGRAAFWGCSEATSVTLPASIESIGEYAIRVSEEGVTVRAPVSLRDTVESWYYGYRYSNNDFEWY